MFGKPRMSSGAAAATAAAVSGVLIFLYLNFLATRRTQAVRAELAAYKKTTSVVVAERDINAGTLITGADLRSLKIPVAFKAAGAARSLRTVVGRTARAPIFKGEQVMIARLNGSKKGAAASQIISKGKVALALAVDEVTGVGGGVRVGDYVDIFATNEESGRTKLLYRRVLVRGLGGNYPFGGSSESNNKSSAGVIPGAGLQGSSTIILELSEEQALQITAASERGKLRLALLASTGGD